jgi:hypothetical protein
VVLAQTHLLLLVHGLQVPEVGPAHQYRVIIQKRLQKPDGKESIRIKIVKDSLLTLLNSA